MFILNHNRTSGGTEMSEMSLLCLNIHPHGPAGVRCDVSYSLEFDLLL